MRARWAIFGALLFFPLDRLCAQTESLYIAFSAGALYTTTSRLYLNPDASLLEERSVSVDFQDIGGFFVGVRLVEPSSYYYLALTSGAVLKTVEDRQYVAGGSHSFPLEEGLLMIPLEFSGHIIVPADWDPVRISVGAGFGAYYLRRHLSIAGVRAEQVDNTLGYSLVIQTTAEYRLLNNLWFSFGMFIRNPEAELKNKFTASSVLYDGYVIHFPSRELKTRLEIDGVTFGAGLVYEFR